MAVATALLIFLLATPAVFAAEYIVGDGGTWTQGADYTTWTSGKTFRVGDVLVFNYGSNHKVDVVSKSDYDNCVSGNALESHDDGNTKINLTAPGPIYFICPTLGHCSGGMKLAVTVAAAGTTPPSGTPPTTPSGTPPSGSDTPAGTPPTTPSTNTTSPSGAATTLCNTMLVIISLVGVGFMG